MLSKSNAEMLIHAFMTLRLDYCNALLGGCSARLMNEWMMHLYRALLCIAVHPKRFTIMVGGVSPQASTWMMQRQPQDNGASMLTAHKLQVERKERDGANQMDRDY